MTDFDRGNRDGMSLVNDLNLLNDLWRIGVFDLEGRFSWMTGEQSLEIIAAVNRNFEPIVFNLNFHISAVNDRHESRLTSFEKTLLTSRNQIFQTSRPGTCVRPSPKIETERVFLIFVLQRHVHPVLLRIRSSVGTLPRPFVSRVHR